MNIDTQRFLLSETIRRSELRLPELWRNHNFGHIAEIFYSNQAQIFIEAPLSLQPTWTQQNQHLSEALEKIAVLYDSGKVGKYRNGTLFTLHAYRNSRLESELSGLTLERMSLLGETTWQGHPLSTPLIQLSVGVCSYFEHLAYVRGDIPEMSAPNALLISGRVVTSDNHLVFALRKSEYSDGLVGVPGGTYNIDEMLKRMRHPHYPYPDEVMIDELTHELGVDESNISTNSLRAILYDQLNRFNLQPAERPVLLYDTALSITSQELNDKFMSSPTAQTEHSELLMIPNTPEGILSVMSTIGPKQFHGPADLILGTAYLQTAKRSHS